ncbi:two component transcriptional regulator, LytTR family [Filimonas lacunae]|uniref:Two component transcriptional regulator, LytTR family n=1 Tax=Filimonas lacunae TaxID=477680 RepID=A0A173MN58_9BACT|nr:LytTR family DNA-binding domain-containing protein [Filimonas lacunae]BAV08831.1 response regulator [Filimonas lacunae]SIS62465.1 two component transcriptional regulator, LytTR family [Filimonas lacunae]
MNKPVNHICCLLLEDEEGARQMMQSIIQQQFPELVVYTATNLAEARSTFQQHQPQVLILDVNLPDGNSFELLTSLYNQGYQRFKIVFITAFADYAVQAFRFSALDFLLKPYTPQEFTGTISKVLDSIDEDDYRLRLETFFHNTTQPADGDKKIVLTTLEDIHIVKLSEILQAESDNNYTRFYFENGKELLVSQPLKTFEKKLDTQGFMRVHQSHLVNLHHITAYRKKTNQLVLKNNIAVPVSQNKKTNVMEYLGKLS